MIDGLFNSGSMPVLERMVQFTSRRHQLLLHNIANISTPNFRPADVSPASFQQALGDAIDDRRSGRGDERPLDIRDTTELRFTQDSVELSASPTHDNLLFHDRNDRSLEHQMKNLAENTMAHNAALEMLRGKFRLMETAISGRV